MAGKLKRVIEVRTWEQAKQAAGLFGPGWVFRGQSRRWPLRTALERLPLRSRSAGEKDLFWRFYRQAHQFPQAQALPDDVFAWSGLMQHYGAPTRLLDCTRSYYVGLFFALEDAWQTKSVLFCFDLGVLRDHAATQIAKRRSIGQSKAEAMVIGQQNALFGQLHSGTLTFKGILPLEPWLPDPRQLAQQALFLCPCDLSSRFGGNLAAAENSQERLAFRELHLRQTVREEGLEDLRMMNITQATLFPGLDGFARSLRTALVARSPQQRALDLALRQPSWFRAT